MAIGSIATVLALMPSCLPNTQSTMVARKVTATTVVRQLCCMLPSILSSMVVAENGNILRMMIHAITSMMSTIGAMISIQSPKLRPRLRPAGSFNTLKAKALGGVPIGVPIPPRLAPIGMAMVSATRPLPEGGNDLNTGVRKVSIMAAVAVFDMNIEKMPVMSMKPSSTFSERLPNGAIRAFAIITSSPLLVAAMASTKPPRKRMMVGSAKHAITP